MARLNKFASVNLNDSYGKPDQQQQQHHGGSSSAAGSKSRISSGGGMLVLTRPGRAQPRTLGIPSPINLPSLKREGSGVGATVASESIAVSPPVSGWAKVDNLAVSPPAPGWNKSESPNPNPSLQDLPQKSRSVADEGSKAGAGARSTPDTVSEGLKSMSFGKPDVYAPPALRALQGTTGSTSRSLPPTPTPDWPHHQQQQTTGIIRGEEFPTLQAAVARPPTPPQHPKQKDLHKKQQQQQPQQQQQEHHPAQRQTLVEPPQASILSLRPQKVNVNTGLLTPGSGYPANQVDSGHQGNAFIDGSSGKVSPSSRVDDTGHNLRPQYRSPVQTAHDSLNMDSRPAAFSQNDLEPSWSASSKREFLPSRNGDHVKVASVRGSEDVVKGGSDMRSASFGRGDGYSNRDMSASRESVSAGYSRENSHDSVHSRDAPVVQRSFVKDTYNGDPRESNSRGGSYPYSRDVVDIRKYGEFNPRDNREVYNRNSGEFHNWNGGDAYYRDSRDSNNQDMISSRPMGHGHSNRNGDNLQRDSGNRVDSPYGRGPYQTGPHSPGPGHDSHYNRRYGSYGSGDQHVLKDERPSSAPQGLRVHSPNPYSGADAYGSRRAGAPSPGRGGFDSFKEVRDVRYERSQRSHEEDRNTKFDDKRKDVRPITDVQQGPNYSNQKVFPKKDVTPRVADLEINRQVEEERNSRDDLKKQLQLEDERRKEAARLKLIALEEKIARRAAEEGNKETVQTKEMDEKHSQEDAKELSVTPAVQESRALLNLPSQQEVKCFATEKDTGLLSREDDMGAKYIRPSSVSSVPSWSYKSSGEGLRGREQDSPVGFNESLLNQERKAVRSQSPTSWRKEVGNGPKSKLFSSPYIESGGIRRPNDGGTYKLF